MTATAPGMQANEFHRALDAGFLVATERHSDSPDWQIPTGHLKHKIFLRT
jgi:hypothetical protein